MTYNAKLTALHKSLTKIHPEQDRINFAPKLAGDIRILLTDNTYLTFNNIDEETGTIWVCSDIDGWWNFPEPSIPDIQRGFGDGSFEVNGRNLAREMTFTGSILVQSGNRETISEASSAARLRLFEAFNLVKRGSWLIVDEDEYKRASFVRLSGRPEIKTSNSRGRIDFSFGLRAADPIKYEWIDSVQEQTSIYEGRYNYLTSVHRPFDGDYRGYSVGGSSRIYEKSATDWVADDPDADSADDYIVRDYAGNTFSSQTQTPDTLTVTNNGNTPVFCYFRVVGPFYGPGTIQNFTTGQTMNFLAPTGVSNQILSPTDTDDTVQYIDINTKNREVHLGDNLIGTSRASARYLLEPLVDWIYLEPGDNTIYFNDAGVGYSPTIPTLQVYWRSGWIG